MIIAKLNNINYAETKEQCEIKLAEMIEQVEAEIAEEKAKRKEGDSKSRPQKKSVRKIFHSDWTNKNLCVKIEHPQGRGIKIEIKKRQFKDTINICVNR